MQEALRRYKEEVAADPDTDSGFYHNTNEAFGTKQYVLVCPFPHDLKSSFLSAPLLSSASAIAEGLLWALMLDQILARCQ